jgi:hypothetical protein
MPTAWNTGWLNENAGRAYPFKEDISRTNSIGVTIPDTLLVDLIFVVAGGLVNTFYLKTVLYGGDSITLVFADSSDVTISSIVIDLAAHQENQAYDLVGVGSFEDARGRLALGNTKDLHRVFPEGVHNFTAEQTTLESRTVRPDLRGVRYAQVVSADGDISDKISGIIRLTAGQNIQLVYIPPVVENLPDPITGEDVPTTTTPAGVRIDAIDGIDFNEECDCESVLPALDPILTINGVEPDNSGNITLESTEACLKIDAASGTISLADTCSTPCCGCTELEFLTSNAGLLEATLITLASQLDELDTREIEFFQNVLETLK